MGFADTAVTIGVGQTIRVFAELNQPTEGLGALVTFVSDNGGILAHDGTGPVASLDAVAAIDLTGLAPGTVTLRAYISPSCADPAAGCGGEATVTVVGLEDPPAGIDSLLPEPAVVPLGGTLRMTVTLRVTPVAAPAVVTLSSESASIGLPSAVEVPPGLRSATFDVEGTSADTGVMLTATMGDSTLAVALTVE